MAYNKVVYGDETLIDLTSDTVTPDTLAEGVTAHNASGERIVGELTVGSTGAGLKASNLYHRAFIDDWNDTKPRFTNYAPPMSEWGAMGNWSNYEIVRDGDTVTTKYTSTTSCYESGVTFPANNKIFKPGETWEVGFKKLQLRRGDTDLYEKIIIMLNFGKEICPNLYIAEKSQSEFKNMKSATGDDQLIAIHRFTIPSTYSGGMPSVPLYVWPINYAGGDDEGLYSLTVEGLYLYKIDEHENLDDLPVRGEDPSNTYIMLNRVAADRVDEDLEPDSFYLVDDGSMFATDYTGKRVDSRQKQIILVSSTEGSTKRFKITVDDSGSLTASEIVM